MLVALLGVLLMACASGPPASHYVDLLDELRIPAGWELAHTTVWEPFGEFDCNALVDHCPAVDRYYLVGGLPADAYPGVRQMTIEAGMEIEQEHDPGCPGLRGNDRLACYLITVRGSDLVYLRLYEPGVDPNELGIARPRHFVIQLSAYANPAQEATQ